METKSSLDRLAHIANITHELTELDRQIKLEKTPDTHDTDLGAMHHGNMNGHGNHANGQHGERHRLDTPLGDHGLKPRRLACTSCRQQKLKCDAQTRDPLPCTRCEKKGIECVVKADFKRTEKRARLALIEKEFAELKKTFTGPVGLGTTVTGVPQAPQVPLVPGRTFSSEGTPHSVLYLPAPGHEGQTAPAIQAPQSAQVHLVPQVPHQPPHVPLEAHQSPEGPQSRLFLNINPTEKPSQAHHFAVPDHALLCEEKSLGTVTLLPEAIVLLYMDYVRYYHPTLPVVEVARGPERIYRLCPSLFWVIMFVALRRYDDNGSLLLTLLPLIKDILSEITISPITRYHPTEEDEPIMNACSVYSVQAFIIYSIWPPLTSSLSSDSSWNTIGVALFQSIRIGLHSSGQVLDQAQLEPIPPQQYAMAQEQMKTWIVCNIVSQNIATVFGFPAFVQFDSLRPQYVDLPVATRHLMEIAHFEDQVARSLTSNTRVDYGTHQVNERLSLIKVLLRQLDQLELKLTSDNVPDNGYRKIKYIVARVHLLTHYFLDATNIPPFELSKGLVRLYNAAISLITCVQTLIAIEKDFVKFMPVVSILNIWQASFVIVKLANSPLKSVLNVELGKLTYMSAITIVAKASILKHDVAYRASGIMRNMWPLFKTLDEKQMTTLSIRTRTRMAASLFFDCLSLLRDQVGMAQLSIRTDVRDQAEDNDEESNLYGEDEEDEEQAVSSDEEVAVDTKGRRQSKTPSQKSTPGSITSSGRRRRRSLSNVGDAESKARRIIRTIPLDPQPIAASKRSSIFKVVNTSAETSPSVRNDESHSRSSGSPGSILKNPHQASVAAHQNGQYQHQQHHHQHHQQHQNHHHVPATPQIQVAGNAMRNPHIPKNKEASEMYLSFDESPSQGVGNLDVFDVNSDLIWKDVDSLMNDFGFHA